MNNKYLSSNIQRLKLSVCSYVTGIILLCLSSLMPYYQANAAETTILNPAYGESMYPEAVTRVYWGDTHVHTNMSLDAAGWGGNSLLTPDDAYLFAQGKTVITHNGISARLREPLDFIVVADHIENLGVMTALMEGSSMLAGSPEGEKLLAAMQSQKAIDLITEFGKSSYATLTKLYASQPNPDQSTAFMQSLAGDILVGERMKDVDFRKNIWSSVTKRADYHNQPGNFTAFIGYEWTSSGSDDSGNLHRVVVYGDNSKKASAMLPFTKYDSADPEDLWDFMDDYESMHQGHILAIPHNGNLSNGLMFNPKGPFNRPMTASVAKSRSRWEPLYEVTQIKGDSEAHPMLSPEDNFANYETWDSWQGWGKNGVWNDDDREKKQFEYARPALKLGLEIHQRLGVNPFKFGMIGSTDSHTSLATADENNFFGKWTRNEPSHNRVESTFTEGWTVPFWNASAAGYAAVWAEENTRASLFAAMKRKEVYASTGPRITVRFFGGWDYEAADAFSPEFTRIGYEKGIPMGGEITNSPTNKKLRFLIRAVKDPSGANLDRLQVIKGWLDHDGRLHEKVYDVALSDRRKPNWRGKIKPVGNTVDIPNANYANTIGDAELAVVWRDPDFDKDELAFYYVRVLEIPTPRWTAYDAKYFGLKKIPEEIPMVTQERAYTSPIWYSPSKYYEKKTMPQTVGYSN